MDNATKRLFTEQARIFKALGHPSRLIMAEALTRGPLCVCDLHRKVGGDLSTVSRHLAVMKEAGVVTDAKRGTSVFYSLALPCLDTFLHCTGEAVRKRLSAHLDETRALLEQAPCACRGQGADAPRSGER